MKARVFVGSSAESVDVAYAIQENLERYAEVTVWTQGIFELSKFSLEALVDVLDDADFGAFVFAPDDLATIRRQEQHVTRDNVVFELGLFVGRLGRERCFVIVPRDQTDFHFPTDLLGLTPGTFDPNREDGNLTAALGPACHKIERAIRTLGVVTAGSAPGDREEPRIIHDVSYDENDKKAILASWLGSRSASDNTQVIAFASVDRELRLEPGAAKTYLKEIAGNYNLVVEQEGANTILFRRSSGQLGTRRLR